MNQFKLPLFLKIEDNLLSKIARAVNINFDGENLSKIILISSAHMYELYKFELDTLSSQFHSVELQFVDDSTYSNAMLIAHKISVENFDLVIGFGGGKILDVAKYASYVSKKKFVAIPATLSNDGIASPIAVLKIDMGKSKSFGCKSPDGLFIDLSVIIKSPLDLLQAGIGDVLSNYTALYDWDLDSSYNHNKIDDFAFMLSSISLNMLISNKEQNITSSEFIRLLAQSLILNGIAMEIAGNSRPCSGSEHLFSHSLDEHYALTIHHGLKVALGTLSSTLLQG